MGSLKPLYKLPVPSTHVDGDAEFCEDTRRFQYFDDNGVLCRGGIGFSRVAATRTRAERCCTEWHIQAYDTLVEVPESSWAKEIYCDTDEMWRDEWEMHHFLIYVDSSGSFELIAESWEPLTEERGARE